MFRYSNRMENWKQGYSRTLALQICMPYWFLRLFLLLLSFWCDYHRTVIITDSDICWFHLAKKNFTFHRTEMTFTDNQRIVIFDLTCLELILCLFAICVVTISVLIIVQIRLFHWNFTIIIINFILQFFIGTIAGFLTFWWSNVASA